MWTLVGAGVAKLEETGKLLSDVLPKECVHFKHRVEEFDPENNQVTLASGEVVSNCIYPTKCPGELHFVERDGGLFRAYNVVNQPLPNI